MLMLMDTLDKERYASRTYVVAATDPMSGPKALARERLWQKTVGTPRIQLYGALNRCRR